MSSIQVSVIIPAYNASATIAKTLTALAQQDCSQPYEIIVVDDGSTDDTAQAVQSFPKVKYVHQENAGPASARNHGAQLAQGQFLAFTDADCTPHRDWLSCLMRGFDNNVAVVCGSYGIANPENYLAKCVHAEIVYRHRYLVPDFPKVFGSYNFCVRKNIFEAVGGFNTAYRRASGEDNDLSYKIFKTGQRIYFQRQALVDHRHPTQVSRYLQEQFRHGFWRVSMYADHPQMARGDGYTFWKDIVEVPWAGCCCAGMLLAFLGFIRVDSIIYFLLGPLLALEILAAYFLMRDVYGGFFFGFVLFLRAFARLFGFSTGILAFLAEKHAKKIK